MSNAHPAGGVSKSAFAIIFCVSLATAMGNTGLISVLPTIGRSIGIPDFMVSGIFSLSALLWAISSPVWARSSDRRGRKPLIMTGLTGFMISMIVCGLVVSAGLRHLAAPMVIFVLFLMGRALFGLLGSAANPASQVYVAERTPPERRTQALASLAGAVGMGTVIGPTIAPLFVYPVVGLAGPLFTFALIAAAILFVVWRFLPEQWVRPAPVTPLEAAAAKRLPPMWRDPRVQPFLVYGFIVSVCQTAQTQTLGFLIIDKLSLSPRAAQGAISMAMAFGAVAGLLAQWGIIRMFEMTPRQLLRWGVAVAAAGNMVVALSTTYSAAVAGYAIACLGFGFARPGFTAGSSLAVKGGEQARVAGAIASVNGINVIFAPLFVLLYERLHPAPFFLNVAVMAGLLVFAFKSHALRNANPSPATRADTAVATLERSDEGGI